MINIDAPKSNLGKKPSITKTGKLRKPRETPPVTHELLAEELGGRPCSMCGKFLTLESFTVQRQKISGRSSECKACAKGRREERADGIRAKDSKYYTRKRDSMLAKQLTFSQTHPEIMLLRWARDRARKFNLPFSITAVDIVIPETCPVFGFPLVRNLGVKGKGVPTSPSLDRIIPELGYVPGNVRVISRKANAMKSDYDLADLQALARWILTL